MCNFLCPFLINTHKTAMKSDKKSFKLLIFFILLTSADILARNIVGKILDEDRKPIGFANVAILTTESIFIYGT